MVLSACTASEVSPTATVTIIPTSTNTPFPTHTKSPTLVPTSTPFPEPISGFLFNWPISPLTNDQIQEVLECQDRTWSWPNGPKFNLDTIKIENPQTACDFGLQALANIEDKDTLELSKTGIYSAQQALLRNPGIIFSNQYFFYALGSIDIVDKPTSIQSQLKRVIIQYEWGGIGHPIKSEFSIHGREQPIVSGYIEFGPFYEDKTTITRKIYEEINVEDFQSLDDSLINLIPVNYQAPFFACYDNSPDWIITLEFLDNSKIKLRTNISDYYLEGGPFQTELEGQNYVLASYEFNRSLINILETLEVFDFGASAAMSCQASPVAIHLFTNPILEEYLEP